MSSNLQALEMAKSLAALLGREVATHAEYRQIIGLPAARAPSRPERRRSRAMSLSSLSTQDGLAGLSMDGFQLTLGPMLRRAEPLFPERTVTARTAEGGRKRRTYAEVAERAKRLSVALRSSA